MWIAVFNNLEGLAVGLCWTLVMFWLGRRYERLRFNRFSKET